MHPYAETIRRLKLDRAAIAYTVAAWAVIQAAAMAAGAFAWPNWILQAVIVAALLGLPAALVFVWAAAVRREQGSAFRPARHDMLVFASLIGLPVAAAGVLALVFWPRMHTPGESLPIPGPPAASLAVLPFANVGGDPAKRYFSDGLSDELINALARIPSLRVAARSSSFAFADKARDARAIARALNVRALLEGSVREEGNRVRISAQLVNGANGFQMWSQSYDRELTDVLALQDDIARSVTSALSARLMGRPAGLPSVDPEAYRLYLQGKFYVAQGNKSGLEKAIALLQRAVRLAPGFADGLAMLGNAQVLLAYNYDDTAALASGEKALRRTLEINPRDIAALKAMTDLSTVRWRWQDVLTFFRTIIGINPDSYDALVTRSGVADTFGFAEESTRADMALSQLDPLSLVSRYNLAAGYFWQHKYEDAARSIHEALALNPGDPDARNLECSIEVARGNLPKAKQLLAMLPKQGADQTVLGCAFEIAVAGRNRAQARAMVDRAAAEVDRDGGGKTEIGDAYLKVGEYEAAQKWYERAYAARERALLGVPGLAPPEQLAFFQRPEWKALWNKPPIRAWEAARKHAARILGVES